MNKLSTILLIALACSAGLAQTTKQQPLSMADRPAAERITRGPVVEQINNNSATIAWSTDIGGSSVIRYGTDRNHLTQMAESPYAVSKPDQGVTHRVKIEHLRPGTTYFFMVDSGQGQGTGTEARSTIAEFTTKH